MLNKYGLPLRSGDTLTKFDWNHYTAASSTNTLLRQSIFDRIALWLREAPKHVPFSDKVDSVTGVSININRPGIGAVFAPLAPKL